MRSKPILLLLPAVVAVLVLWLAVSAPARDSGAPATTAATKTVSLRDDFFSPATVRIHRGDKVVWRWKGSNDHNVTFKKVPSGVKRPRGSGTRSTGSRFAHTFKTRGTYRYVCTIHQSLGMKGRVIVQ
jgi:plastocyanin